MARILILSLVFRPDNVSTAQIMGTLAVDLEAQGHEVFVISTVPHYNDDNEALQRQPLQPFWGKLLQRSLYHGIQVLHVWMPRKSENKFLRIIAWLGFHAVSTIAALMAPFKPDLILAPSPPLTIGLSAWLVGRWHGCPFVYNVQEIYPDVAVNLGVLRNPIAIAFFKKLERFVYSKANKLTVISESMANRIREKTLAADKIRMIPNFVDCTEFRPLSKENNFSLRYGLDDKFVVSYAGNMGKPQGLDTLIEAASHLTKNTKIHFLLMGDGSERAALLEHLNRLKLSNVTFLDYQPYSIMPEAYAAADASFVSQARGTSNDGIPSKVYRIMACARPVIACTDPDSDLAFLVESAGGGIVVNPGDPLSLANAIERIYRSSERWLERSKKARRYVLRNYSRSTISKRYHDLIMELGASSL